MRGTLIHDRRGVLILPVIERKVLELGEQAAALDPADVRRGELRGQVRILTVGGQVARVVLRSGARKYAALEDSPGPVIHSARASAPL